MILHFHKWSAWSDPVPTYDSGRKRQWRRCTICNKVQHRSLSWDNCSSIIDIQYVLDKLKKEKENGI